MFRQSLGFRLLKVMLLVSLIASLLLLGGLPFPGGDRSNLSAEAAPVRQPCECCVTYFEFREYYCCSQCGPCGTFYIWDRWWHWMGCTDKYFCYDDCPDLCFHSCHQISSDYWDFCCW